MDHTPGLKTNSGWSKAFKRVKTIPSPDPELNSETWCKVQPCMMVKFGSIKILLTQPTSTFFVYLLGVLTIGVGFLFLLRQPTENSHTWWGISLLLWGIGALLAGTSYQAFGYQIKCAGQQTCAWTSWWEVIYLIFQQASIDAMLIAVAISSTTGIIKMVLIGYALICALLYTISTFIGGILPKKALITFDLMVWVSTPIFVILVILNGWRYFQFHTPLDLSLLGAWGILILTMLAYWLYDYLNLTPKLWVKGIWFSENDVLHIGLIIWMIYLAFCVLPLN